MSSGMWLLVALFVAGLIGVAVQHYAMKKMRSGFSLRGGEGAARGNRIAVPEDEAARRWLEADDADENEPQRHRERGDAAEKEN